MELNKIAETDGTIADKAVSYFNVDGWNCAESIYMAIFGDYYGMNVNPKTVSALGGGIARTGNICGAINVGIMGISQTFGRENPRQHFIHTQRPVYEFLKRIVDKFGSIYCSQITDCQLSTLEGIRKFRDNKVKDSLCTPLLKSVIETFLSIVNTSRPDLGLT